MAKEFFRCTVCNDIHYGSNAPEVCPTCFNKDVYQPITAEEAKERMEL